MMIEDSERIRGRIHDALGVVQPHPSLRARVMASMPVERDQPRRPWAVGSVALLLAVALIADLVFTRASLQPPPAPAGRVVGSLSMTTQLEFACTLPVVIGPNAARIRLPDGQVTVDRVADISKGPDSGNAYSHGRWLPVGPRWVSPDGRSYAYYTNTTGVPGVGETTAVYVHDVTGGRERRVWSGPGGGQMVAWVAGEIYFSRQPSSASTDELWAVSPTGKGVHRVGAGATTSSGKPVAYAGALISGGGAWTTTIDEVWRLDLADGSSSLQYTAPGGAGVSVIGADARGRPVLLVGVTGNQPAQVLLTGPNQVTVIGDGTNPAFKPTAALGDAYGIWFNSPSSIWLYRGPQLIRVATVPDRIVATPAGTAGAPTLLFGGGCQ
jgi:hypothetical protein